MSTALHVQQSSGNKNNLYVLRNTSEDGPRVLCMTSVTGIKTLPLFSNREAARRFLRATPLRFGLLRSGWRPGRILGSELGAFPFLGIQPAFGLLRLICPLKSLLVSAPQSSCRRWLSDGQEGLPKVAL